MRISDWSSDVCSSDLIYGSVHRILLAERLVLNVMQRMSGIATVTNKVVKQLSTTGTRVLDTRKTTPGIRFLETERSEEHTSELQSLMRTSYAVFCLKKKT